MASSLPVVLILDEFIPRSVTCGNHKTTDLLTRAIDPFILLV